jgi:hypothetical protein
MEIKPNFSLTKKCFSLINFSNGKQIHESLESDSRKPLFAKQTRPKSIENILSILSLAVMPDSSLSM